MFATKLTLANFLDSISIRCATVDTWTLIIGEGYDTIDKILAMSVQQIAECGRATKRTIGERASKIYSSLHSNDNLYILEAATINAAFTTPQRTALLIDVKGKRVCMTGAAPVPRDLLKEYLTSAGAIVQSAVSSNTDILFCESKDSTSSKAKAARVKGVRVMGYIDLLP